MTDECVCVCLQCASSNVQQPWQFITDVSGRCWTQLWLLVHRADTVSLFRFVCDESDDDDDDDDENRDDDM